MEPIPQRGACDAYCTSDHLFLLYWAPIDNDLYLFEGKVGDLSSLSSLDLRQLKINSRIWTAYQLLDSKTACLVTQLGYELWL